MIKAIQIPYNSLFELKCRLASQAGFRHIAVNFTEVTAKTEGEWEALTDRIREILEQNRLSCIQSHPYYYDLLRSSELVEEAHEFAIRQAIIASGKLGAAWCVLHPRTSLTTGRYVSASFEDNRRVFGGYLETAKKYGTGIAAENLPVFGIKPAIPFYSSSFEDLCALTDSFADPAMAVCWDTGHAHLMSFDQAGAIRAVGSRIQCTHIHNNFRQMDNHLPPDQGNLPWDKVMKAFSDIGYRGPLTLETHCCYDAPELLASFARHNFACLEFLEGML